MRALRVPFLLLIVAATGLLTGAAATPAPVASVSVAAPVAAPAPVAVPAPVVVPARAAAAPAVAAPAVAPAAPAAVPALVPGTPCAATVRACISLSGKKTWLIRGGAVEFGPVPITSGRPGFRTPPGTFHVTFKDIDHRSSLFNGAPMPFSVFFNGGIAFHQGSLTVPSHGCIHLSRAAAQTYFGALRVGDVVQVVA